MAFVLGGLVTAINMIEDGGLYSVESFMGRAWSWLK